MKRLMPRLQAGMQIYHRGYPFQLLFLTDTTSSGEFWRVKPLWDGATVGTSERFFAKGSGVRVVLEEFKLMGACA